MAKRRHNRTISSNDISKVYLVDYENIKKSDFIIPNLCEKDCICIFYSNSCKNISLPVVQELLDLRIHLECSYVAVGTKNALDFQLASYLGYLIGTKNNDNIKYYIVSNDKGFDCICDFWRMKGITVERIYHTDFEEKIEIRMVKDTDIVATLDEIKDVLGEEEMCEEVLTIFNQYKTKQAIYNGMSKLYKDSKKASEVYKKLKPLLQKK